MNIHRLLFAVCTLLICKESISQLTYKELKIEYDSVWTCKNLQLIPITFKPVNSTPANKPAKENLPAISLFEALQKNKIKLQEIQNKSGADVNWLQVTNRSKQPVLIQSGEMVSGGKQDRMMAETKLLGAGQSDFLHVYCIEKRRWDTKPKEFSHRGTASSELRKTMDTKGRQHEVWKEIDRQYASEKRSSETFSYLSLFNDSIRRDTTCFNYFKSMYRKGNENFAGFVFITSERILGCELFGSASLTDLSFNNLLQSYYRFASPKGATPAVPAKRTKEFMDKILSDEVSQKIFVGAHGKLYVAEGKIVHLVAYED